MSIAPMFDAHSFSPISVPLAKVFTAFHSSRWKQLPSPANFKVVDQNHIGMLDILDPHNRDTISKIEFRVTRVGRPSSFSSPYTNTVSYSLNNSNFEPIVPVKSYLPNITKTLMPLLFNFITQPTPNNICGICQKLLIVGLWKYWETKKTLNNLYRADPSAHSHLLTTGIK